jgi:hypothetical protein
MGLLRLWITTLLGERKDMNYKQIGDGCNHQENIPEAYSAPV